MQVPLQVEAKGRAEQRARPGCRTRAPKTIAFRRVASSLSTQQLGAKLSPEIREWVDRVIVPALMRECLEARGEETAFLRLKIEVDLRKNSGASARVKP